MMNFQGKLGVSLMNMKREKEAEKVFDFIIAEDNRIASAHTNLGRICFVQGRYPEAKAAYDKALSLDPDNLPALKNEVDLLLTEKKIPEAKMILKKILKLAPNDKMAKDLLERLKSLKMMSTL